MTLTVEIPDDLAGRLRAAGGDLSRRVREAFAPEEYKAGHISKADLRRLLGLSRYELDGFLQAHEVWADVTIDDLRRGPRRTDLLLMDDREGVIAARSKGVRVAGTLGVLVMAAERALLNLADAFDRIKRTSFHYPQELIDRFLAEHSGQA